jgi:tetratricopeptide (TPR) repeat protein
MKPDDAMVLKQLGTAHYNLKNWSEADKYLRLHLDRVDGDWQVHYHLGEIHYITSRFEESKKYYRTALNKIHASNKHPYAMQVAQAHCLNRLGAHEKSIIAYESLIQEHPRDLDIRASFITALMEHGDYNRARQLLKNP